MDNKQWKVGFIGLGKLGLPVATAMALRGADVVGYDLDSSRMSYAPQPYCETGPDGTGDFNAWLALFGAGAESADALENVRGRLRFGELQQLVAHAEVIFIAVQTPHDARYEGVEPLSDEPADFDYTYLVAAVEAVVQAKRHELPGRRVPLVVISTCLPGTMRREVVPRLQFDLPLVYNPSFIAMGTTMRDFLDPEYVLIGADDAYAGDELEAFYAEILPVAARRRMSVPSAELAKVAYNTALSQKIALANAVMEICHKTPGANCDDVTGAMKAAHRRVASGAYMDGGQGDGGGCHPRDNIAMMYLARELRLSYSPFGAAMRGREEQARWLCSLVAEEKCKSPDLGVVVAGYAYKPRTNITTGSAALLCAYLLEHEFGIRPIHLWDPRVREGRSPLMPQYWEDPARWGPRIVLVGCHHPEIPDALARMPLGSVVVDPFRCCRPTAAVRVVAVGVGLERGQQDDDGDDGAAWDEEARVIRELRSGVDHD